MAIYNAPLTNPVQAIKVCTSEGCLSSDPRGSLISAFGILTRWYMIDAQVAGMVLISTALVLRSVRLFVG